MSVIVHGELSVPRNFGGRTLDNVGHISMEYANAWNDSGRIGYFKKQPCTNPVPVYRTRMHTPVS